MSSNHNNCVVEENIFKIGPPRGKITGSEWNLRGHSDIVQIFISYGSMYVHSICFQYVENGALVLSPLYGSSSFDGSSFQTVQLDFPLEKIIGLTVECSFSYVNRLSIHTNKATYGPFGTLYRAPYWERNIYIGLRNQFAGFHGTSDSKYLSSIGVYCKPFTTFSPVIAFGTRNNIVAKRKRVRTNDDGVDDEDNNIDGHNNGENDGDDGNEGKEDV